MGYFARYGSRMAQAEITAIMSIMYAKGLRLAIYDGKRDCEWYMDGKGRKDVRYI